MRPRILGFANLLIQDSFIKNHINAIPRISLNGNQKIKSLTPASKNNITAVIQKQPWLKTMNHTCVPAMEQMGKINHTQWCHRGIETNHTGTDPHFL
ncbi:MAG: hypothetical protein CM1200mP28_17380 [Deltaproteobacteria bacterium]|nr:MAG: hypothetical protein CM1200mP28_17380 [Deltaproteobacteria bacterium]